MDSERVLAVRVSRSPLTVLLTRRGGMLGEIHIAGWSGGNNFAASWNAALPGKA